MTGLTSPVIGGGLDMSVTEQSHAEAGLRTQIEVLTDELDRHGTRLLITIDELQRRVAPEDMRSLSTVIQHAFREERPVAFTAAGLPSAVDELLSDDVLTFLRRGVRRHQQARLLVHEPALRDLSEVDRTFLAAMAHDAGPSRPADIAARLQCTSNYSSQYRLRLIAAGIIEPAGYGKIRFALPHLSDYLREHAATLGITPPPGTELRP